MSVNLENSAVATGLRKVGFHSNPVEGKCQRMFKLPHNCTHFICYWSNTKNLQARLQAYVNQERPDIQVDLEKAELEVKHLSDHGKSKRIKKERKNKKKTYFFTDYAIAFDCVH